MRSKTLITLSLALLLFLFALGTYAWWYRAVVLRDKEVQDRMLVITEKSVREMKTEATRDALTDIEVFSEKLRARYVHDETVVQFLDSIAVLGRTHGTDTEVASVSVIERTDTQPAFLSMDIRIEGSFGAVMRTIGSIENLPVWSRAEKGTVELVPNIEGTSALWRAVIGVVVAKE